MEGRLLYALDGWPSSDDADETETYYVNLARDLSLANRKHFDQCSAKGVPLIYHARVTISRGLTDDDDVNTQVGLFTAQSNWVTRNAAVKTHFAREAMYKNAGVKKSERGRYDKTLKLNFDTAIQTWKLPEFNDGATVYDTTGADWDVSSISISEDAALVPTLFGTVVDEESAISAATFNIQNAYLASRRKPQVDDLGAGEDVSAHSILRQMMTTDDDRDTEIQALTQSVGDGTPYNSDAIAGTFTSAATAAYVQVGNKASPQVIVDVDIPFGLMQVTARKTPQDESAGDLGASMPFHIEVLGISEMQG